MEIIVHLGLDTVELRGEGFERLATEGERVEAGRPIVRFDLGKIKEAGYDPVTPVLVSNAEEHPVRNLQREEAEAGSPLFTVG